MKTKGLLKKIFVIVFIGTFIFTVVGCKKKLDDTPLENLVTIADFSSGKQKSFFPSDGWSNGEPFNVTWSSNNVEYKDGAARLFISKEDGKLYAGELRSSAHYWYGDYEVVMKPDAKTGTCTSFFTYTGPSETDENGNRNPHDEIDIEFLGKDTTHVQFNFFVNGKGGNEYKYDLGFDASEEYHRYGFRWTDSYITWYVDGEPVYRVDETARKPLPKTPGRIMMNYWSGTKQAELWMKKYTHTEPNLGSYYTLVQTSAEPIVPEGTSNGINWEEISSLSGLQALGDEKHVITTNESSYNVKYNGNVGATYTNVKLELEDKAKNTNFLYLKATNNNTKPTSIRVDVVGDATRKTVNNKSVCNVAATMDNIEVPTDMSWGGSSFNNIKANSTVEIVIYFEGIAESIQIMFETHIYGDTATHSGDVTISDIKFAKFGELKLPEGSELDQDIPTIKINGLDKTFDGNVSEYKLSAENNKLTAIYENVKGDSYLNINTQIADIAANKDLVSLKITNNGSALAKVRIDVDSTKKVNDTTACNISATANGQPVYTDTTWGGSMFEIPAGSTVECIVKFDNTRGVKQLMFYIDSSTYQDSKIYSGNITFSEINFDYINEGTGDVEVDPNGVALEFATDGSYQIVNDAVSKSTTVTYENIIDSSYQCICANLSGVVEDNNKITFMVKNNGSEDVTFRVDVGYTENNALVSKIKNCVNATFNSYDNTASFTVAANATLTITIEFDINFTIDGMNIFIDSGVWLEEANRVSHSGNVTIQNVKFHK